MYIMPCLSVPLLPVAPKIFSDIYSEDNAHTTPISSAQSASPTLSEMWALLVDDSLGNTPVQPDPILGCLRRHRSELIEQFNFLGGRPCINKIFRLHGESAVCVCRR